MTDGTAISWPEAAIVIALLFAVLIFVGGALAGWLELRTLKIATGQDEDLRRLIARYEQLATQVVDGQQRTATDLSDVRGRTAAIEQILRTVE